MTISRLRSFALLMGLLAVGHSQVAAKCAYRPYKIALQATCGMRPLAGARVELYANRASRPWRAGLGSASVDHFDLDPDGRFGDVFYLDTYSGRGLTSDSCKRRLTRLFVVITESNGQRHEFRRETRALNIVESATGGELEPIPLDICR